MQPHYLDHASTTPLHPAALDAMTAAATEFYADPSRLYGDARRARIALDQARDACARAIGGRAEEIVFTASGTESCNLAVIGGARAGRAARKPARIIVSAIEHTAVLQAARSLDDFDVELVPVDRTGRLDLAALARACTDGASLVSVQLANNEIGTLQPIGEAARIAREAGALFHVDACAAVGNFPTSVADTDLFSASAHKFYGPKGAGFLWARRGVRVRPISLGDDRERGRRAGMENLPAIVGMAAALDARITEIPSEVLSLRALTDRLRDELPKVIDDVQVHGHPTERLPGLVAFSVLYVQGEALLLGFDEKGIAVHSGSSCTSSTNEPSHVLAATGSLTEGSIRVSFGRTSTEEDRDALLEALPEVVTKARKLAGSP